MSNASAAFISLAVVRRAMMDFITMESNVTEVIYLPGDGKPAEHQRNMTILKSGPLLAQWLESSGVVIPEMTPDNSHNFLNYGYPTKFGLTLS